MQNLIHRQDVYLQSKKIVEEPSVNNDFLNRLKTCFYQSFNHARDISYDLAVRSLPNKIKLGVHVATSAYHLAVQINAVFFAKEVAIPGLSDLVKTTLYEELDHLFESYFENFIPQKLLQFSLLQKAKKRFFHHILQSVFSQIPSCVLREIKPDQIQRLFREGYVETFKEILKENTKTIASGFIEDQLVHMISQGLGGISHDLKKVLTRYDVINEGSCEFTIETTHKEDNTYSIELFTSSLARTKTTLDGSQSASEIVTFENLSEEEYRSFCQLIQEIKEKKGDHLSYSGTEFPDVISLHLKKPYVVKVISTHQNGLFSDNQSLIRFRQKAQESAFEHNMIQADASFIALLLAETSISYFQRRSELNEKSLVYFSNHVSQIRVIIEKTPIYANRATDLNLIGKLQEQIQHDLKKALQKAVITEESDHTFVIPPIIWKMIDQFFATTGFDTTLLDNICIGLENVLGEDFSSVIACAKEEYLKRPEASHELVDFSSVTVAEYGLSIALYGFIQFAIYDLIFIALGFIFPPAFAYGSLLSVLIASGIAKGFDESILPERMRLIANHAVNQVIYACVPHLIELGFYLFVSDEIRQEIAYQLQVIDAFSFKSQFRPKEDDLLQIVRKEDETIFETAKAIKSRLFEVRRDFHETILEAKEKRTIEEKAAPLFHQLSITTPLIGGHIQEVEEEFSFTSQMVMPFKKTRIKLPDHELLKFIQEEIFIDGILSTATITDADNPSKVIDKSPFIEEFKAYLKSFRQNRFEGIDKKIDTLDLKWDFRCEKEGYKTHVIPRKLEIDFTTSHGARKEHVVIAIDLIQVIAILEPAKLELLTTKIEALDPHYREKLTSDPLRQYKKFALENPQESFPTAILALNDLSRLSLEALVEHLQFWNKLLRSSLTIPTITSTEKTKLQALIAKRTSQAHLEATLTVNLERPQVKTSLQSAAGHLIPYVAQVSEEFKPLAKGAFHRAANLSIGPTFKSTPSIAAEPLIAPVAIPTRDLIDHLINYDPQQALPKIKEPEYPKPASGLSGWLEKLGDTLRFSQPSVREELDIQLMPNDILYYFDETELQAHDEATCIRDLDDDISAQKRIYKHPYENALRLSEEDQLAIARTIVELQSLYPEATFDNPDALFSYFNQVEAVYKKQMRLYLIITSQKSVPHEVKDFIFSAIFDSLEKAITKIQVCYETEDHPFFSPIRWTVAHTNLLARLVHRLSLMQRGFYISDLKREYLNFKLPIEHQKSPSQNDTFSTALWKASTVYLIEKLIKRENRYYQPLNLFDNFLLSARYLRTSNLSEREKRVYHRLASIELERFFVLSDHHLSHISALFPTYQNQGFWYYFYEKTYSRSILLEGQKRSYRRWKLTRNTILPQPLHDILCSHCELSFKDIPCNLASFLAFDHNVTAHAKKMPRLEESLITESFLENLLIESQKIKRSLKLPQVSPPAIEKICNHFNYFIAQDLLRFEKEIQANFTLSNKLIHELYSIWFEGKEIPHGANIPRLLVFLDECLKKHHMAYESPLPHGNFLKERIELQASYFYFATQESPENQMIQKIVKFLAHLCACDHKVSKKFNFDLFLNRILSRFFLEKQALKSDPEFLKNVFNYVWNLKCSGTLVLDDYDIPLVTDDTIELKSTADESKWVLNCITFELSVVKTASTPISSFKVAQIGPTSGITYEGVVCYDVAIKRDKKASKIKCAMKPSEGNKTLVIYDGDKVLDAIVIPKEKEAMYLKEGIVCAKFPYFKIAREDLRLPPILNRFLSGKGYELLDTLNGCIEANVVGLKGDLSFFMDERTVTCSLLPNATFSDDQTCPDSQLLGNYLIFEKEGKKYALFERNPPVIAAIPAFLGNLSSFLRENATAFINLIPSYQEIFSSIQFGGDHETYGILQLSHDGKIIASNIDDYAMVLLGSFHNMKRFKETLSEFLMKIELNEPLEGSIEIPMIFMILSILQIQSGNLESGRTILEAIWTYLQSIEIHQKEVSVEKKALLILLSLPIYLSYFNARYDEIHPIPLSTEAIFLHELFTVLDQMITEKVGLGKKVFSALESVSHGFIYPLVFSLFSESFRNRMQTIDSLYPQTGSNGLLYHLIGLTRTALKYSHFTRIATVGSYALPMEIGLMGVKAIGTKALTYLPSSKLKFTELKSKPLKISEALSNDFDEDDIKKNFYFLIEVLFVDPSTLPKKFTGVDKIKTRLIHRLETAIIPETSKRQALRFLQFIYFKKLKDHKMTFPLFLLSEHDNLAAGQQREILFSLLNEFHQLTPVHVSEGLLDWGNREVSSLANFYGTSNGLMKIARYVFSSTANDYLPQIKRIAFSLDVSQGLSEAVVGFAARKKRESAARYFLHPDLVADNEFFQGIFTQLAARYFDVKKRSVTHTRSLTPVHHASEELQSYYESRIERSFEELAEKREEPLEIQLLPDAKIEELIQEIQEINLGLKEQLELLKDQVITMLAKKSGYRVTIDELYKIALNESAIQILQERFDLRLSVAELVLTRISLLALYTTYQVKCEIILGSIEKGLSIEEIALKISEKKHYPIAPHANIKLILGCLLFEAKNRVWLRPLQAHQMIRALEDSSSSCLIEMIPGSGKTAFAILLDLFHRHEKGTAMLAVFTPSLITSTKKEVAERFYRFTGKRAFLMTIDREKNTETQLKHLLHRFKMSQDDGDVIITTKEDLQALELLYIENLILKQNNDKKFSEEKLLLLKQLLLVIKTSRSIVDECHQILKPDEIEKYPLGEEKHLKKEDIIGQEMVFDHLAKFLQEKDQTFDDIFRSEALVGQAQIFIAQKITTSPILDLTAEQQIEALAYLSDISIAPPAWLLGHKKSNMIAMIRGAILELLPSCQKDKIHTTYGLSNEKQEQRFVIPYSGNNTPIEGSIFESAHETLFKTYLFYLQSQRHIELVSLLFTIQKKIEEECSRYGILKEETTIGLMCLKNYGKVDLKIADLKANPRITSLLYVTLVVAPTITFYDASISSTSSDFAKMLGKVDYYSGTVYNSVLYPTGLKAITSKETTAETLETVSLQFKKSGEIVLLSEKKGLEDFIEAIVKDPDYMMGIDTGALFNGHCNKEIAYLLASRIKIDRKDIKAILFFDETNTLKVLNIESLTTVTYCKDTFNVEECFTYLDQNHSFGVDIPQKKGAKALISVGRNILADIEQSCWRLRGLKTLNQTASFALLPECQKEMELIGQDPKTLEGLISYLVHFELEKLKPHCLQASFHQINAIIRNFLIQKTLVLSDRESLAILREFEEFFIESKTLDPMRRYGLAKRLKPSRETINRLKENLIVKLTASSLVSDQERLDLQAAINLIDLQLLPKTTLRQELISTHMHGTLCRQRQLLKEELRQQNLEKIEKTLPHMEHIKAETESFWAWEQIDTLDPSELLARNSLERSAKKKAVPICAITELFTRLNDPDFLTFSQFLRPDMVITHNVIPFTKLDRFFIKKAFSLLFFSPLEKTWNHPVTDLLIIQSKSTHATQVVALDVADSIVWEKKLLTAQETVSHRFAVVKVDTGTCFNLGHVDPSIVAFTETEDFKDLILRYKIFNCSDIFSLDERTRFAHIVDALLKRGFKQEQLNHSLKTLYEIRRCGRSPGKMNPLIAIVDRVADPTAQTVL